MSKYLLKLLGSGEIVNIIEWNGSGSLIAPSGYEFEPFVTESVDFINYFDGYTEETIAKLFGELEGKFSGELTGSITINGKTFEEIMNETPYGELRATDNFDTTEISASNMFFVSGSTISLPRNNMVSERYTEFFENVIDNNIQNYKLTLKKTSDPNEIISYIISDTEIINDDGFDYIKLSVNNISGYDLVATQSILNPSTPNDFFYKDEHSSHEKYYVDFSLPTDLHVGTFYGDGEFDRLRTHNLYVAGVLDLSGSLVTTGSISVTGSLKVNGNTLATERSKYGALVCETFWLEWSDSWAPSLGAFRLAGDGWNWSTPSQRILLDQHAAIDVITNDYDYVQLNTPFIQKYGSDSQNLGASSNYFLKLFDIINKGLTDTIMILRSVDWPNTYKKFKIKGGTYYTSNYRNLDLPFDFAKLNWGDNISNWGLIDKNLLPDINRFTNNFDVDKLIGSVREQNHIMWSTYGKYQLNNPGMNSLYKYFDRTASVPSSDGFFDLEVEEIESYHEWYELQFNLLDPINNPPYLKAVLPTEQPKSPAPSLRDETQNDLFWIDFEDAPAGRKKEIHIIETSQEFTIPSWVTKTTIYTIGAGGGGGGGTAGFMHSDNLPIIKSGWSGNYFRKGLPKSFGHELLSGGGGGAGGNVSIGEFDRAEIPAGSVLQLIVGSGGLGGSGYGFANTDNTAVDMISMITSIQNPNDSFKDVVNNRDLFETFSNFLQIPQLYKWFTKPESSVKLGASYFYELNKIASENDGKRGGFSAAILKSTPSNPNVMRTLIQADGGLGGRAGIGVRSFFMFDQFRLLTENKLSIDKDCVECETQYLTQYWVPGGGSSIGSSFSPQNRVYLGGAGGYGITMGSVEQDFDIKRTVGRSYTSRQGYGKIVTKTLKRNTAPPQKWEENVELPDLKLPYGDSGLRRQSPETMQKSSYPAPTGGGGGAGKVMFAMENRLLSEEGSKYLKYFFTDDQNEIIADGVYTDYSLKNINGTFGFIPEFDQNIGFPNNKIFDDYYKDFAIKINSATTLGEGGKFISSNVLFDDRDSNGVRHTIVLGRGGNGGYDVSNNPHASLAGFKSNILPTNGSGDLINGFGGGGGGGAARFTPNVHYDGGDISTVGQDGADGGKGVVIIVLES